MQAEQGIKWVVMIGYRLVASTGVDQLGEKKPSEAGVNTWVSFG
jgi:hypothetical protein